MIEKKRGQGKGYWNAPGGKLAANETPIEAARRECSEETGIEPVNLKPRGQIKFYFVSEGDRAPDSWDNVCDLFVGEPGRGELVQETDECRAAWVEVDKIPFERMWEADRKWLPRILGKQSVHRAYTFNEKNQVIREEISDEES